MSETEIPQKTTKGGIHVLDKAKSPRVVVKWTEEGKIKVKNFCIKGQRNKEEAEQQAIKFYEENIKPKYELWKKYNDERLKQNKLQYNRDYNKIWSKKKFKCECGYETAITYKSRHLESVYHELCMKGMKVSSKRSSGQEKYTCECGSTIEVGGKEIHEETLKHKKYLETKDRCDKCNRSENNCNCGTYPNSQRIDSSSYNSSYNSYRMK